MASGYDKLGAQEMFSGDYTVIEKQTPVYCLQGGGATSQNSQGMGYKTGTSYTLNTIDRPAVAYEAVSLLGDKVSGTLMARDYKGIGRHDTLGSAVCIPTDVRYIVRRLTPTECARLQGFPDTWGHPDAKTEFTDEEYQFWLNVRNTHAAINDKPTKEYTKDQILKWYNGLHTDSSEYKMWGNGIALPNALYMMQGIADVMTEEKAARRKWLDDLLGGCL
jgi:DNA (cytosine-5)-methyltransferase 1